MKHTPLYSAHQELGAKLVEFGGWEMPVQYTSITDEHLAVRRAAGLFDISHMGEFMVHGPDAELLLNHALTNDVRKLTPGTGQYTLMCNEQGGVIDDLYVYCLAPKEFLLIVNASRIADDFAWLTEQLRWLNFVQVCHLDDVSNSMGAVAIQGPKVAHFIDRCLHGPSTRGFEGIQKPTELKKNQLARFSFSGEPVWVSRTGYTGEDGFEVVSEANVIGAIWNQLLAVGGEVGLKPAGLGARDTLRTEVCYPLYGHELDEHTTPVEAGLSYFVAWDKGEFNGRAVLAEQKQKGISKKLVAFKMTDKSAPPRPHYLLWGGAPADQRLGEVASGTQSPSLGIGIGMGYVPTAFAKTQTSLEVEIRGRRAPAVVVPKPFYRKAD